MTRPRSDLAAAVFANYELTAKVWKAQFRYRVKPDASRGDADGFVFMFYKDKGAYGVPDSGSYKGFQVRTGHGDDNLPVQGYGLEFDDYYNGSCDPITTNFIGTIANGVCNSSVVSVPDTRVDDSAWHTVQFFYDDGKIAVVIDKETVFSATFPDPNTTYTGIGFGASTGSCVSTQTIDDFKLWVREGSSK